MAQHTPLHLCEALHEELRTRIAQEDRAYALQQFCRAMEPPAPLPPSYRALLIAAQAYIIQELAVLGDD